MEAGMVTLAEKLIALILPPIAGALVYFGAELKTTETIIISILWALVLWFGFAIGFALDEFY